MLLKDSNERIISCICNEIYELSKLGSGSPNILCYDNVDLSAVYILQYFLSKFLISLTFKAKSQALINNNSSLEANC